MPPFPKPVSQAQRGAMYAAAQGHSTLDIPAKVGKEFVKGDEKGQLPAYKKAPPHFSPLARLAAFKRHA